MSRPPGVTIFTDMIGYARARTSASMPSSLINVSALGERPDPHVLSRGKGSRSINTTFFTPR